MRKLLLLFILIPTLSYSQKIKKDEVDEFENVRIIETDWINFTKETYKYSYVRIRNIDSTYILDFKIMLQDKPYLITEGENLMFKIDDEIIKLTTPQTTSGIGDGSINIMGSQIFGIFLQCPLTEEQVLKLKDSTVNKFRIVTTDGYFEADVKTKFSDKLKSLITLVYDKLND